MSATVYYYLHKKQLCFNPHTELVLSTIKSNSLMYKMHHEDTSEVESSINLDHDCKAYTKLIAEGAQGFS